MASGTHTIGWIGLGRMGEQMADRLIKAGWDVTIWNRTKSKAEPLVKKGGKLVDKPADLAGLDVVFTMVSTGKDLDQVLFGANGVMTGTKVPKIVVDCSSISVEESAKLREKLAAKGSQFVTCPVSGNAKVIKAGKLSAVASGPKAAYDVVKPMIDVFSPRGTSYVGDGELSRICKIAHNVMLGVVIQNLVEITILAQKHGVPRHAFLEFMNNSVMGSMFTKYKSNALVNLDWTTTFTHELLLKDLDLGLAAGHDYHVPMPVTAAARQAIQSHYGTAFLKPEGKAYLEKDFAALLETFALQSGLKLEPENVPTPTGLE
jgi:3-hydroxyisobutyrate dehydrogenase